jgi:hypothetical protein
MERQLAQSIAEDNWRLNRICAIENNMFALGHANERREAQIALADAQTFQDHANKFNLLTIYEQRINRSMQRNLKLLREMQAERKQQHDQALEEAKLLAQASLANGVAYVASQDGFVFSAAEINRAIDRDNRVKAAKAAALTPQLISAKPQIVAARAA